MCRIPYTVYPKYTVNDPKLKTDQLILLTSIIVLNVFLRVTAPIIEEFSYLHTYYVSFWEINSDFTSTLFYTVQCFGC